jgi:hypothetical protein
MNVLGTGGAASHHRARLFPLPCLAAVVRPPSTSQRVRVRFQLQRLIVAVTNRAICSLNSLYNSPSTFSRSAPRSSSSKHFVSHSVSSQPDNKNRRTYTCPCCRPSDHSSAAQQRALAYIRQQCTSFVLTVRTWSISLIPLSAYNLSPTSLDMIASLTLPQNNKMTAGGQSRRQPAISVSSRLHGFPVQVGVPESLLLSQPVLSSFSSAPTAVVPLIADRISLPQQLTIVPMLKVLPPDVAARYSYPAWPKLLRSPMTVLTMDFLDPLPHPSVVGSRVEYLRLIDRMRSIGMASFTGSPEAVNGAFAVGKDADNDRLIINARHANRKFVDSPHVSLPNPSHLVQMCIPKGATMYSGKTDLADYYHHIGIPEWLQPYLALPPLTPAELAERGLPADAPYPMCTTLPMGFSHAVSIAQCAHEHILYSRGVLQREHCLLSLVDPPVVSHHYSLHGICIDDFFIFSLSRSLAERTIYAVLEAYREAGFVVKQSKVVMPTSAPVKIIGFDVNGAHGTISLPVQSQLSLVQTTLAALHADTVTGSQLSHVVGRWTWVMMLRRASLAVLQHVYRYCRVAQRRQFTLWACVRRELSTLLGLLPLLHARLDAPIFHRIIASDASEFAAGVVSTPVTPSLHSRLYPLCSNRHHAVLQARCNAHRHGAREEPLSEDLAAVESSFDAFYNDIQSAPWRTLISKKWAGEEHINTLELRTALLAVHWVLSYPSSVNSRVYLLLDSTVSFFSLWKGRSSSPSLLLVLRKISALLLAGGLSLLPGWVPSAVNPADGPSRLQPRPMGRTHL